MRTLGLSFFVCAVAACGGDMTHTDGGYDAGDAAMCHCDSGSRDGGPSDMGIDAVVDAGSDAGVDAGTDAGVDTGVDMTVTMPDLGTDMGGGGRDAGPPVDAGGAFAPVLDGVLRSGEWDIADVAVTSVVSDWTPGNQLRALHAMLQPDGLWIAIEGQVDSGNAIVVYVDSGEGDGVGVADLSSLTDSTGALDDALSAGFMTPTDFAADLAYGTTMMNHSASDFDDAQGWRDIATDGADFHWLSAAEARTNCGPSACETFLPRADLGGPTPPRTVALFARIVSANGMLSPNQTLPEDDSGTHPRIVTALEGFRE